MLKIVDCMKVKAEGLHLCRAFSPTGFSPTTNFIIRIIIFAHLQNLAFFVLVQQGFLFIIKLLSLML